MKNPRKQWWGWSTSLDHRDQEGLHYKGKRHDYTLTTSPLYGTALHQGPPRQTLMLTPMPRPSISPMRKWEPWMDTQLPQDCVSLPWKLIYILPHKDWLICGAWTLVIGLWWRRRAGLGSSNQSLNLGRLSSYSQKHPSRNPNQQLCPTARITASLPENLVYSTTWLRIPKWLALLALEPILTCLHPGQGHYFIALPNSECNP